MQTQRLADPDRRLRAHLRQKIQWGRLAVLGILAVTFVNQIMLWLGMAYHFLPSAAMPYYVNWLAGQLGGAGLKVLATLLTLMLYGAFGACAFLSGVRREWMLAAVGFYAVDTLVLTVFAFAMLENPASCFLEILVHLVLLVPMVQAVQAYGRLERLPRFRPRRDAELEE